jgi:DNA-binding MarR family transcriptional regulator
MINRKELSVEILSAVTNKSCGVLTDLLNDWTKGLYVILRLIDKSKEEVVAGDIAQRLNVSTARVAVALRTLEDKKWIKKHKSKTDARKTIVMLTELGKNVLRERMDYLSELVEKFLNKLTEEEILELLNIIKKTM